MVAEPTKSANRSVDEARQAARGRALFENHFDLIQQRLRQLSRRSGLPDREAEALCSWALLRLVENDYRALAKWEGRSSFSTYLTVVLVSLMLDYRRSRLGPTASDAADGIRSRPGRPWPAPGPPLLRKAGP